HREAALEAYPRNRPRATHPGQLGANARANDFRTLGHLTSSLARGSQNERERLLLLTFIDMSEGNHEYRHDTLASAWVVFEVCNSDAPCPCRKLGDRKPGRSTYDTCDFVLSWHILEGRFGTVQLKGCRVAIAGRWDNREPPMPGSSASRPPWRVALYV